MRSFKKPKRIRNKKLLEKVSELPCLICKRKPPSDPHHLKTKGSGGSDTPDNLIPLCRIHHTEIHQIGRQTFIDKYEVLLKWIQIHNREDLTNYNNEEE